MRRAVTILLLGSLISVRATAGLALLVLGAAFVPSRRKDVDQHV